MNLNWIVEPLTMYGALAAGGAAALHLVVTTKMELRRQYHASRSEADTLRETVEDLRRKLADLSQDIALERTRLAEPAPALQPCGINIHKRAEALRMFRRGGDRQTVSARLGLTQAETALLEKIQHILTAQAAQPAMLQERSSSLAYSPEA